MKVTVTDVGDDVLEIVGSDADTGQELARATGWKSATTNHYDPSAYDADGNLLDKATPRPMTDDELQAYASRLLLEQNPQLHDPPPELVTFTDPSLVVAEEVPGAAEA